MCLCACVCICTCQCVDVELRKQVWVSVLALFVWDWVSLSFCQLAYKLPGTPSHLNMRVLLLVRWWWHIPLIPCFKETSKPKSTLLFLEQFYFQYQYGSARGFDTSSGLPGHCKNVFRHTCRQNNHTHKKWINPARCGDTSFNPSTWAGGSPWIWS